MKATKSFTGGCEPLIKLDVFDLIEWVSGIIRDTWPDWGKSSSRPAVINDPDWENLKERTDRIVWELLKLFPGCRDTYRSITTIHPGDYVPLHTDTLAPGWVSRIHVPIVTNDHAVFIADNISHHMRVGMSYQVNPSRPHAVANYGDCSRIHLMFDVIQ